MGLCNVVSTLQPPPELILVSYSRKANKWSLQESEDASHAEAQPKKQGQTVLFIVLRKSIVCDQQEREQGRRSREIEKRYAHVYSGGDNCLHTKSVQLPLQVLSSHFRHVLHFLKCCSKSEIFYTCPSIFSVRNPALYIKKILH